MHTLFGITLVLYLLDYIFHILQYFATKLYSFTKFRKLFPTVLKLFSNLKLCLIGEWSISERTCELRFEVRNFARPKVQQVSKICNTTVVANMSELDSFIGAFADKLDTGTVNVIKNTLQVNGFTTRLQIKLISDRNIEMMFQGSDM